MQNDLFEAYKVDLEAFEGPLDLLLHLIRKEEIDIFNIPIDRITTQYLDYLGMMNSLDITVAGEFIVMAATLMMIKSRMLLPATVSDDDASDDEWIDPRLDLVRQLIEYRKFKDAADALSHCEYLRSETFPAGRPLADTPEAGAPPLGKTSLDALAAAFKALLDRTPTLSFGHLEPIRWSVPQKIHTLGALIRQRGSIAFENLFDLEAPRGEIIVTFIALLELLRLRHALAAQDTPFSPIIIEFIPEGTPDSHLPLPAFDDETVSLK